MSVLLTFADLGVGDRFVFAYEYGHDCDWMYLTKTGAQAYESPGPRPLLHEDNRQGRVGVGDQPVIRRTVSA